MGQETRRFGLFEHLKPALGWVLFCSYVPGPIVNCPETPGRADSRKYNTKQWIRRPSFERWLVCDPLYFENDDG